MVGIMFIQRRLHFYKETTLVMKIHLFPEILTSSSPKASRPSLKDELIILSMISSSLSIMIILSMISSSLLIMIILSMIFVDNDAQAVMMIAGKLM